MKLQLGRTSEGLLERDNSETSVIFPEVAGTVKRKKSSMVSPYDQL